MQSIPEVLFISKEHETTRLDSFLARHYGGYSRTYFQNIIEKGLVLVNGRPIKKREKPKVGDEIEICFVLAPELSLEPQNIPLEVLFEDEHLIVVNKPAGMVVHPAPGHPKDTFVNALLFHCKNLPADDLRPGIVHRLDKDTSGALIAAKTTECHRLLIEMFSKREIEKTYLAVCMGNPGDMTISAPIARHATDRKKMCVSEERGKEAVSVCTTLYTKEGLSVVEVKLITGRTHQIRVHLQHRGTPVLGDPVYGSASSNQKYGLMRQMLHAKEVCFEHPITKNRMRFNCPLPLDMKQLVQNLSPLL